MNFCFEFDEKKYYYQGGTKREKIEKLGQKNKIFRDYSIFDRFLPAKHTFKKFENKMSFFI